MSSVSRSKFLSFDDECDAIKNSLAHRVCLRDGMVDGMSTYARCVEAEITNFYTEREIEMGQMESTQDLLRELHRTREDIFSKEESHFDGLYIYVQHLETVILALYQAEEEGADETPGHLKRIDAMNQIKADIMAKERLSALLKANELVDKLYKELEELIGPDDLEQTMLVDDEVDDRDAADRA